MICIVCLLKHKSKEFNILTHTLTNHIKPWAEPSYELLQEDLSILVCKVEIIPQSGIGGMFKDSIKSVGFILWRSGISTVNVTICQSVVKVSEWTDHLQRCHISALVDRYRAH